MIKSLSKLFLAYLRVAAKFQLRKMKLKHIVGITGSAGKSSARDAVAVVLKEKYRVKSSKKSLNSEFGVPLDILGFTGDYSNLLWFYFKIVFSIPFKMVFESPEFDVYVVELGVDRPSDMNYLLRIVRPDVGVFLNALPVHTANFSGRNEEEKVAAIAAEKGKVIESLPEGGSAILNADDPSVIRFKSVGTRTNIVTFGKNADVKTFLLDLPGFVLNDDYGYTLAAAVAVGVALGITEEQSKKRLKADFGLPPGRMSRFDGINDSIVVDSTYNASPITVISALKALAQLEGKRKIAILGDMRELGTLAKQEHEKVAVEALVNVDLIFTFGPLTEEYFPNDQKIRKFRKMSELIDAVKNEIKKGDTVLVKGSQNTIMLETLVEAILASPSDVAKLCRRGEFWEEKRRVLKNN